ncbi:MAG: helix-turn-helix domain-containing protein [Candidatus Bathyarchaeota archaeon]|nr:helix-turn-helix domain-containing protein [Candidatus Bathyarchaeota archaeon]
MRRLIIEIPEKEIHKAGIELPPFKKIKALDLLYFLRHTPEEFAAIVRVEFKDPNSKGQELLEGGLLVEAQVLEKEKKSTFIVFLRSGPSLSSVLSLTDIESGFLFPPMGVKDGKIKFSFLGNENQVKKFIEGMNTMELHYRVVLLADAEFSPTSPLNQLTEKQREVLIAAYQAGYYDIPRKISSQELAKKLGLVDSTVVEHLRKAEHRLITHILEQ